MSYDKCALLLPMNGADAGTVFTDWSPVPKVPVRSGAIIPETDTAQSKFYGSSGLFPTNPSGSPGHLRITNGAGITTGQFTVRGWLRVSSTAAPNPIFYTRYDSSFTYTGTAGMAIRADGSPHILKLYNFATAADIVGTTAISADTWVHWEISRDASNVLRIFTGGNLDTSTTVTSNLGAQYWTVGGLNTTLICNNRWLQDVEVFLGVALHTASFTPPARRLGTISNSAVGASKILDINGSPAERTVFAVPRVAPTRVWSGVSDVAGEFSIQAPAGVDHSVVALADESDSSGELLRNDIVHRVIPV